MWGTVVAALCIVSAGACRGEPTSSATGKATGRPPAPSAASAPGVGEATARTSAAPPSDASTASAPGPATRYPAAARIVAIGDVHGDLAATRAALRLAGAIDADDHWIGGDLVVVQTGDQLDRGDDEQAIVDLFERLATEAEAAGGAVHALNGNHEFMNVVGDLRYVTPGGFADFADVADLRLDDPRLAEVPQAMRPRYAAFAPGGPYARVLSRRNTVVIVGDTVFVHGGVLPRHVPDGVRSLERLNADARAWLKDGKTGADTIAQAVMAPDGVVWTRAYSDGEDAAACEQLQQALAKLGAARMVVGHTVQSEGITSACDDRVWRIDVGMAAHYGGRPAVLSIEGASVRALGPT